MSCKNEEHAESDAAITKSTRAISNSFLTSIPSTRSRLPLARKITANFRQLKVTGSCLKPLSSIPPPINKLKSDKKTEVVNFKKEEVEKELGVKFNTLNKENYKDFILKVSYYGNWC